VDTFLAWDILCGKEHPELGGSPEILDIVGANNYSFGQMEYREQGPHAALEPDDDRIKPLCDLMKARLGTLPPTDDNRRNERLGGGRAAWLKDVMEESLAAVNEGMDLHGICLFPGRRYAGLAHRRMAA
jgi:hypothetical protein